MEIPTENLLKLPDKAEYRAKNGQASATVKIRNDTVYIDATCDSLKIIAVTGTNGKTTTCNTIADILRIAGKKVGVIGTLGAKYDGKIENTGFTTPDPYILHSLFAKMKRAGMRQV